MSISTCFCGHCGACIPNGCLCPECGPRPEPARSGFATIGQSWPLVVAASRRCCLTAKDSAILEGLLARHYGADAHVRNLLRAKLGNARIVLTADVDPETVTLESRIRFRLGGSTPAERVVTAWNEPFMSGLALAITTPVGAALLGMRPSGEAGWVLTRDGIARSIEVLDVLYQPEAARRRERHAPASADDDPGPDAA